MKPHKILFFLISIFLVLFLLSFVFPKEGVQIGNNLLLRFPDIKSLFTPEETKYADITEILAYHQSDIVDNIDDLIIDTSIILPDSLELTQDSLNNEIINDSTFTKDSIIVISKDQPGTIRQYLEYPDNN
ncbi:MAG: hypothetical protein KAQ75_03370, partial [Bacteroidales bacterium]|nr:hypothetical protein [Bacteroidales bacterium]